MTYFECSFKHIIRCNIEKETGIDYSIHAGFVIVAGDEKETDLKIERGLTNDMAIDISHTCGESVYPDYPHV